MNYKLIAHGLILLALLLNIGLLFSFRDSEAKASELEVVFLTAADCSGCFDLTPMQQYLEEFGITDKQINRIEYNTRQGKKYIKAHDVKAVPTMIVIGNNLSNNSFLTDLADVGSFQKDKAFVLTKLQPPYYDLEQEKIRGDFELILLDDETCAECYDINEHRAVIARLVMQPQKETVLDISQEQARSLIDAYNITAIPTIILRGDLEPYGQLQEIWPGVGTMENDGAYVLRDGVASMGAYKVLPGGDIIQPQPASLDQAN